MKKMILRLLLLAMVGATLLYGKTIGIFLKTFFRELMASPKRVQA